MKALLNFIFLAGSLLMCNSQIEQDIVLVNVEHLDRSRIAKQIEIINALNPRVVAIDLQFNERRYDGNDVKLIEALWSTKILVMPSLINTIGGKVIISLASQAEFSPAQVRSGFINALPENDELGTIERFIVYEHGGMLDQGIEYHFAVKTAFCYDSLKTKLFVDANPRIVKIDFKEGKRRFKKYSANEILEGKLTKKDIAGKLVMIGFLGPGNEDKFYTPLNKNPKEPDMYGLEYLANIVAQILEDD